MWLPRNAKQVLVFLGFVGYYHKFIKNLTPIAKPITTLTWQDVKFTLTQTPQTALFTLKQALIQTPILHYPDPPKHYIEYTDTLDNASRAQLSQEHSDEELACHLPLTHTHKNSNANGAPPNKRPMGYTTPLPSRIVTSKAQISSCAMPTSPLQKLLNGKGTNSKMNHWSQELATYNVTFK